ncbi:MAG: DUF5691 domain-containing protein [Pseudomonadota bacterium]
MVDWLGEREKWRRQLILGLGADQVDLDALSLLAARSRFDELRPGALRLPPTSLPVASALVDPVQRQVLVRLFKARSAYELPDAAALRVLDALHQAGLALHPFDYPELAGLMQADPSRLDRAARHWLKQRRTTGAAPDPSDPATDDERWWDDTPGTRAALLLKLRSDAPERARALLEEVLTRDTAATRGKLLATLAKGLSEDDVPLLEKASADRAQSVRAIADRLLAQLPGTAAYRARAEEVSTHLKVQRTLTGGVKITVITPKAFKGRRRDEWFAETFDAVDPLGLAEHLGLGPQDFCRGLNNATLAVRFTLRLIARNEFALAQALGARYASDFVTHVGEHRDALASLTADQAGTVLSIFASQVHDNDIRTYGTLVDVLYTDLRQTLPQDLADSVLGGKPLKRLLSHNEEDVEIWAHVLCQLICILPATSLPRLKDTFAASALALREPALTLAQLLIDIHATQEQGTSR